MDSDARVGEMSAEESTASSRQQREKKEKKEKKSKKKKREKKESKQKKDKKKHKEKKDKGPTKLSAWAKVIVRRFVARVTRPEILIFRYFGQAGFAVRFVIG